MAIILGLDVATSTGWAVYDPSAPAATVCGAIDLSIKGAKKMTGMEVRRLMRPKLDAELCRLIDRWRPDVACIEQPLNFIGEKGDPADKPMPLFKGGGPSGKPKKKSGGPNANTAFMLNQLFAVADTVCGHKVSLTLEVAPTTWQSLTKAFPGDTKARSIAFCRLHRIQIPPTLNKVAQGDAADAAVIAYWAAGKAQEIKMLATQRERAA